VVLQASESKPEENYGEERRVLRHEIKSFWEGVSDHLDKLVSLGRMGSTILITYLSGRDFCQR
jgi:hypothetical protein